MSANSSSSNDSLLHPHPSSISLYCLVSGSFTFTVINMTNIFLLLPLCTFIICHGLHKWWRKRSTSSAVTMSHSNSFTYHCVTMEMIGVFGSIIYCCGIYKTNSNTLLVVVLLSSFAWYGQIFFHMLTCVERYLAIVHPVTYLRLRNKRGVRIRNVTIGCVWLLCLVGMGLVMTESFIVIDFCILILALIVISFCSLSVVCILIRPGPGEQGGRVDQSKQRAFYTIVAILGVLVFRCSRGLAYAVLLLLESSDCVMITCLVWFNLPSSLVLPLLFLHRERKLASWRNNI